MWNLIWVVVFALVHMSCSFMYSLLYANHIHVQMYFQREEAVNALSWVNQIEASGGYHVPPIGYSGPGWY